MDASVKQQCDGFDAHSFGDNRNLSDKAVQHKRTDFLRSAGHLKKQIDMIDKELWLKIHWKNGLGDYLSVLEDLDQRLKHDLNNERLRLQQQLVKLRQGVMRFQGHLTDVKPSSELIEKLKEIMAEVETSINTFKEDQHQSLEELLQQERVCGQELSALEKKIEAWPLADKSDGTLHATSSGKGHVTHGQSKDAPPELKALDAFLQQTGGQYGGWDQYDHQSFLKVWTMHGGRPSYIREVMAYLPARSQEEVLLHEEWYLKLQDLQERKKKAIHRWRTAREREREASLRQREELMDAERRAKEQAAQERRRREEEDQRAAAARLEAWRSRRQQREEQEEERRRREEALQRRRLQEERRRQQELRLAVKTCVRHRREQEEQQRAEREAERRAEMEERRRAAAQLIHGFQERDEQWLETKLLDKRQKEEESLERQKRMAKMKEKVEAHISRDKARVWQPTKGWVQHTKDIGPTGGGPVYQTFHRAVPSWRQDL